MTTYILILIANGWQMMTTSIVITITTDGNDFDYNDDG